MCRRLLMVSLIRFVAVEMRNFLEEHGLYASQYYSDAGYVTFDTAVKILLLLGVISHPDVDNEVWLNAVTSSSSTSFGGGGGGAQKAQVFYVDEDEGGGDDEEQDFHYSDDEGGEMEQDGDDEEEDEDA